MVTPLRRIIGFGLLALVATAGGSCPSVMAQSVAAGFAAPQPAEFDPGKAGTVRRNDPQSDPVADRIAIVPGGRAGEPAAPIVLLRSDWDAFLAETRIARAHAARTATEDAETRLRTTIDETVAAMRAEIPTFVGWRFSFFTTYRLTFTAVSGAVTGTDPESAVRVAVAERFRELVLMPGMVRTRLSQAVDEVTLNAVSQREAFTAERRLALERLAMERGQPPTAAPVAAMVSEVDALDLPPLSTLRPVLPLAELTDEVGWLGQREVLVMAGRQAARRGIGAIVEPTVLAVAPVSLLEAAPFLASAATGATVLGAGLAVEYVALKLWESTEREALEEDAHGALNRYHQELTAIATPIAGTLVTGALGAAH